MAGFNINEYETVASRLARFWNDHPNGRVETELVHHGEGQYIIKAYVYGELTDPVAIATGFAEEVVTTRGVNQTSALENCETSSLGRALANAGYAPTDKRPSREEMEKVQRHAIAIKPPTESEKLSRELIEGIADKSARRAFVETAVGHAIGSLAELTAEEINTVREALIESTAPFVVETN